MAGLDTQLPTQSAGVRTRDCDLPKPSACAGMVGAVIGTATLTIGILRLIG